MSDVAVDVKPMERESKERVRRRLDMDAGKRGVFGQMLGTLSKAKKEDKLRGASEAAQRRQLLEKRLQSKLAREHAIVRRAEQSKKDRVGATRKEEELAAKETIIRHRQTYLPNLACFLLSSDNFDESSLESMQTTSVLASLQPPRRPHGPQTPIFYMPAKLLPTQEAYIARRKDLVQTALAKELDGWNEERANGLAEVKRLRESAIELSKELPDDEEMDAPSQDLDAPDAAKPPEKPTTVDEDTTKDNEPMAEGDDAVEY